MTHEQREQIIQIVRNLTAPMNVVCDVAVREEQAGDKSVVVAAISAPEDAKFLIGKNGQNLQALEHVVRSILIKQNTKLNLSIDVNDYKKGRATEIAALAQEVVHRVRSTQRAEALSPMSPYERRIVHMELASMSDITTESIGQEPQRRIVVKPYKIVG